MADLREGRQKGEEKAAPREKTAHFINEKIVRQPLTKVQIARLLLLTAFCAVLFGALSAVSFLSVKKAAGRYIGEDPAPESTPITIPKDEPETTPAPTSAPETAPPTVSAQKNEADERQAREEFDREVVADMVREELQSYSYSIDDLTDLYACLKRVVAEADAGLVAVYSIQHGKDWFDNSIETTGQYSGIVIAKTEGMILVMTGDGAVTDADAIQVSLADGTLLEGTLRQSDHVMGIAVISVDVSGLDGETLEDIRVMRLGNSYTVRQGDAVVAVGAPAGFVRSSDYGFVSYILRDVLVADGTGRLLFTDVMGDAQSGTFLLNTEGEVLGWVCEKYKPEGKEAVTAVMGISDYKGALEFLSNGAPIPYFGILGQEVGTGEEIGEDTEPVGIYVVSVEGDSPAYSAGIQPGDVITWMNGERLVTMEEFEAALEILHPGESINVSVQRDNGKAEYKGIEFQVVIEAR